MNHYIDHGSFIEIDGKFIPKTSDNIDYIQFLDELQSGAADTIAPTVPIPTWEYIRAVRARRLIETDWTQGADCPLDITKKMQYRAYRQALRDVTTTFEAPTLVVWPKEPK